VPNAVTNTISIWLFLQITKRFFLHLFAFLQKILYLRGGCLEGLQIHTFNNEILGCSCLLKLDTYEFMENAITLYKSFGFTEIAPYKTKLTDKMKFFEFQLAINN